MEWREVIKQEEKHPHSQLSTWSGRARLALCLLERLLRLLRPLLRGLRGPLGGLLQYFGTSEDSRGAGKSDVFNRSICISENRDTASPPRPVARCLPGEKMGQTKIKWKMAEIIRHPPSPRPWQP